MEISSKNLFMASKQRSSPEKPAEGSRSRRKYSGDFSSVDVDNG
jgi:hypothetical protein